MNLQGVVKSLSEAGIAIYEVDTLGVVRRWTDAATRLLGYSAEESIGRPATDLPTRISVAGPLPTPELVAGRSRLAAVGWIVRKDGAGLWANEVTVPLRDAAGRVAGFARVVQDVTAWKDAEADLDYLFTLSVDLMCVAGFDGFFKRVNPSFTRVLGHPEADLLGRPFVDFVHPDDVGATRGETVAIVAGRHVATAQFQNRYRCADGTYRWLEWRSQVNPANRHIYAVARDVTEQKAHEAKLQEYARELERSNADLQQFAYVASHDLQEPLRAVAGCVQMLAERNEGKLDERSAELVGHAVDGAKRLQALINDLLAYSRVGSKGIAKSATDPRSAVDRAVRQLQVAVDESGAAVTVGQLPAATADAAQLAQLFQNLIGNAIKFRGDRPPEIHVSADRGTSEIVFSVRDNGIGIAPEYYDRVFGVFQRLHSKRAYAGTGIGLAICKKIVERHGGRIWIESKAGEGTTVRFAIPDDHNS